jgi:type II secretory pathway predicted ATPase ExeA
LADDDESASLPPLVTHHRLYINMEQRPLPLKHWDLERWPFRSAPGAGPFYPTAGHNEALARIEYLVESRRRLGALLGETGTGKTLMLREATRRLARQGHTTVVVSALGTTTREVLWQTACSLKTSPREDADLPWLWRQIVDRVAENRIQQVNTVLFVDDAGQAGPDLMTQLVRLARLDTSPAARWTVVLAAEPGQAARWNDGLRSLVDLRIELPAWTAEDTVGYIQTALVEAGRLEPLFDDEALQTLHELSAGVPRQVARLADYALLAGAAAGHETIRVAIVEAAYDETSWPTAATVY